MNEISATFNFDLLKAKCYAIARDAAASVSVEGTCRARRFNATLSHDELTPFLKKSQGSEKWFCYNTLEVTISTEAADPLAIPIDTSATMTLLHDLQPIAIEILNRVVRYLRFELGHPAPAIIRKHDLIDQEDRLQNPIWKDASGNEMPTGKTLKSTMIAAPAIGFFGDNTLGMTPYIDALLPQLRDNLLSSPGATLVQEILADARSAARDGNLPRSTLELAMAVEIGVRKKFYGRDPISTALIEHLGKGGQNGVKIIDLIDRVAKSAFGNSFKTQSGQAFVDIDHLFRCRNQIVHQGTPSFRKDNGELLELDYEILLQWWKSVTLLLAWLQENCEIIDSIR